MWLLGKAYDSADKAKTANRYQIQDEFVRFDCPKSRGQGHDKVGCIVKGKIQFGDEPPKTTTEVAVRMLAASRLMANEIVDPLLNGAFGQPDDKGVIRLPGISLEELLGQIEDWKLANRQGRGPIDPVKQVNRGMSKLLGADDKPKDEKIAALQAVLDGAQAALAELTS